jgi:FixJ family two-component response regulator
VRTDAIVYVVDDDAAVRESLCYAIESAGWDVASFDSAEAFLRDYHPARIGCLVLDVRMPGMSGLELQNELTRRRALLPIIFITAHGTVPTAVRALKAGAADFLDKPFSNETLLARIEQGVARAREWHGAHRRQASVEALLAQLTAREREVLEAVVAGKPNKVIAAELSISPKTVEAHRARVMEKTKADSLADLVRLVLSAERQSEIP